MIASQETFENCYRGRQSAIHHLAYMRMAKVLLALELIQRAGIDLGTQRIFDYGFGAGTFFRFCPRSSYLFGVEMDCENIDAVARMLRHRGHANIELQAINIDAWESHPLLSLTYDLILCSHVLEHMADPQAMLRTLGKTLAPGGSLIALVPINEKVLDRHHVAPVDRQLIDSWVSQSGLRVTDYVERDAWFYWLQPLLATQNSHLKRSLAQALSLGIGIPASIAGPQKWRRISSVFQKISRSKPTQAGFVLMK